MPYLAYNGYRGGFNMSLECQTAPNIDTAHEFAVRLLTLELPITTRPGDGLLEIQISPPPHSPSKTLIDWMPSVIVRAIPPVAIAASAALFSGVNTGLAHAQEPTPPPEGDTGIRVYCDQDASCFITEGTQMDVYPADTGSVANIAVNNGLLDPDQAEACADEFENMHNQYLKPNPIGGRPQFEFPGMQFELPGECLTKLRKELDSIRSKPAALSMQERADDQGQTQQQTGKGWECLMSLGLLAGAWGLGDMYLHRKYPHLSQRAIRIQPRPLNPPPESPVQKQPERPGITITRHRARR